MRIDRSSVVTDPEFASGLARVYEVLLAGYSALASRAELREEAPLPTKFEHLLREFTAAAGRDGEKARNEIANQVRSLSSLLGEFSARRERDRVDQQWTADEFNLLEVLQTTHKEVRHSMVLAWVLDANTDRLGTHAQGRLGFQLFLDELGLPRHYADSRYWVRREVAGDESIVDIEVGARGTFLIHIENKIWSSEGADQTAREWDDLQRRARSLGIDPNGPAAPMHALYLTPRGARPMSAGFKAVSWGQIVKVLERFAELSKPVDVKVFAAHYAKVVRKFILRGNQEFGDMDAKTVIE
jgi:hypothetical protein